MGIVHWHLDEYDQALACYEHALQIDRELGDQADMAVWLGNIANIHHYREAYPEALAGYQQALQIHLALDRKIGAGICLGNLGNTYRDMGNYQQAMTCYEQALQYRHEAGDEAGVAYAVNNIGTLYAQMGFFDSALICYQQALYLDLKVGQKGNVADDLGQLANLYLSAELHELAQNCLDRSIPLLRGLGGRSLLCQQLLTQATILFRQGHYAKAQLFCQESRAIAEDLHQESYFGAGLLSLRIGVAEGQLTPATGIQTLASWLAEVHGDKERAAIQYEIWLLDKEQEEIRRKTAELYYHLYNHTPNILYRQRHQELTGQSLPDPPSLP
jgi:tetratricopeptide (TPR) repeat protein